MMQKMLVAGFLFLISLTSSAQSLIKVLKVNGDVKFEDAKLKTGDSISKSGFFVVGEDAKSSVDLLYPEGHKIRLKSGARLSISGENQKAAKILTLFKGKAFLHFQKTPDVPEFQIKTKTAVAGVRGTKFLLEDREGATYLCVCEGLVELSKPDAKNEIRKVSAGQDLWSWAGKALGQPKDSALMGKETSAEFATMGN